MILDWTLDVGRCLNPLSTATRDPAIFGIPIDFVLFGVTLASVEIFRQCE